MAKRVLGICAAALVVVAGALVGLLGWSAPAGAKCSGPSVTHSTGPLRRGQTTLITGIRFATGCRIGGEPSGHRLERIQVHIVQGQHRTLVARGSADADYRFRVTIAIPQGLRPGRAGLEVIAGSGGVTRYEDTLPMQISNAPPSGDQTFVAVFNGSAVDITTRPHQEGRRPLAIAALVVGVVVVLAGAFVLVRRPRDQDAPA